jgi:hypothetical protein
MMQYISLESLLVTIINIRVMRNQEQDLRFGRPASLSTNAPRSKELGTYLTPLYHRTKKELADLRADVMALPGAAEAAARLLQSQS